MNRITKEQVFSIFGDEIKKLSEGIKKGYIKAGMNAEYNGQKYLIELNMLRTGNIGILLFRYDKEGIKLSSLDTFVSVKLDEVLNK